MKMIMNPQAYFSFVDNIHESDYIVKSKFRGINSWVLSGLKYKHITDIDEELTKEYEKTKQIINQGWFIKVFAN